MGGETRRCLKCGAEFVAKRRDQRYCSLRCRANAWQSCHRQENYRHSMVYEAAQAMSISAPVPTARLLSAKCKPANTSAARWRIELRRRANPDYYANIGCGGI